MLLRELNDFIYPFRWIFVIFPLQRKVVVMETYFWKDLWNAML